jgi:hypothetical protein
MVFLFPLKVSTLKYMVYHHIGSIMFLTCSVQVISFSLFLFIMLILLIFPQGANNVKAIVLDQKENFSKCMAEGFSNMRNLVLLILYHNNFSGNINFLSDNLRYLLWHGYPFTSLPSNFEPYYLVELNMPNCSIQRLWEGRKVL